MWFSGYDPVAGYIALWNGIFGDMYSIGETIRQISPYILAGLAVAFAFRYRTIQYWGRRTIDCWLVCSSIRRYGI